MLLSLAVRNSRRWPGVAMDLTDISFPGIHQRRQAQAAKYVPVFVLSSDARLVRTGNWASLCGRKHPPSTPQKDKLVSVFQVYFHRMAILQFFRASSSAAALVGWAGYVSCFPEGTVPEGTYHLHCCGPQFWRGLSRPTPRFFLHFAVHTHEP
jgi:hypothetical protein